MREKKGNSGKNWSIEATLLLQKTKTLLNENNKVIENYSLRFYKGAAFDTSNNYNPIKDFKNNVSFKKISSQLPAIQKRQALHLNSLDVEPVSFTMKPQWRLVIGLGNESVYETAITLHHIYGIPYIPTTAIKGVFRSWVIQEYFDSDEEKAMKRSKSFCDIFGCTENSVHKETQQGNVIFLDAFPDSFSKDNLQPDVMTPHYGEYYQGKKPPADYLSPNPIPFLTVSGAEFKFYFGVSKKDDFHKNEISLADKKGTPSNILSQLIPKAFSEHGIGAKTAVGYGYFKE
ncbi:MAG: type III-B CRISPR module RAMP protein Cmr6 [Bacteroidota bacterium]